MLPDFLAAVRRRATGDEVREVDQVFHSAHDFIATWEEALRAAPVVNATLPPVTVPRLLITIETGTDNLKCGGVVITAFRRLNNRDMLISPPTFITTGRGAHSTFAMYLQMFNGIQLPDVYKIRFRYSNNKCDPFDTGDTWNIKTLKVTYDIPVSGGRVQGVLMHKRGAPAKKLARGGTWTVWTER